jgi:hypothetical protein
MTKPIVQFLPPATFYDYHSELTEKTYELARVYALDHPRLGQGDIRTSIILKHNEDGSFETLNTHYAPAKIESSDQEHHIKVAEKTPA